MTNIEKDFCETVWRFFKSIGYTSRYDELFIKTNWHIAYEELMRGFGDGMPDELKMIEYFEVFDDEVYIYDEEENNNRIITIYKLYNDRYCSFINDENYNLRIVEIERKEIKKYVYEAVYKPFI